MCVRHTHTSGQCLKREKVIWPKWQLYFPNEAEEEQTVQTSRQLAAVGRHSFSVLGERVPRKNKFQQPSTLIYSSYSGSNPFVDDEPVHLSLSLSETRGYNHFGSFGSILILPRVKLVVIVREMIFWPIEIHTRCKKKQKGLDGDE